jgi:hypothetical protein
MEFDKPPTLKEFAETFNAYLNDIGCMDNPEGWIASHKIVGGIRVYDIDEDDETDYEIVGIDTDQLIGCGCTSDVVIKIKKVEE